MWEGLASPSLTQISFLTLILLWAMECQHGLEYFQVVRGCCLMSSFGKDFHFSKFMVVLGAVVGDFDIVSLTLGEDSGLATICTLYLFVEMSFLLLLVAFASPLARGLVLGWVGLD